MVHIQVKMRLPIREQALTNKFSLHHLKKKKKKNSKKDAWTISVWLILQTVQMIQRFVLVPPNSNHSTGLGIKHPLFNYHHWDSSRIQTLLWPFQGRSSITQHMTEVVQAQQKKWTVQQTDLNYKKAEKLENHVWMFDTYEL